jgi:hypothetical protein
LTLFQKDKLTSILWRVGKHQDGATGDIFPIGDFEQVAEKFKAFMALKTKLVKS